MVAANADGSMRTLRKGTNGYTCMPDARTRRDPTRCAGTQALGAWVDAWLEHNTPPAGKVGLMYMLAGGTDSSNTDPYAQGSRRPAITGSRPGRTS